MKILLVDDNLRRYSSFIKLYEGSGRERDDITLVTCAKDAREHLQKTQYDLMILDIVIPLRPEEDPDEKNSQQLLLDILELDEFYKPRFIVGLSAIDAARDRVAPFFAERLWTIISYRESDDSWTKQILNCIDYLDSEEESLGDKLQEIDLLIICALQTPELEAVLQLPWNWGDPKPIDDVNFAREGFVDVGGSIIKTLLCSCPRMGMVSASILTTQIIGRFYPKLIVMPGICAGVPTKTKIGDVILADPTWDYQTGKKVVENKIFGHAIAPHQIPVAPKIRSRFEQLKGDRTFLNEVEQGWNGNPVGHKFKLVIGPVASGSAVLADGTSLTSIVDQHRELCGIEMEAYGVYSAAHYSSNPQPLVFAIKAVCDFADNEKNDEFQRYAAYTSAKTLQRFVEKYFFEIV